MVIISEFSASDNFLGNQLAYKIITLVVLKALSPVLTLPKTQKIEIVCWWQDNSRPFLSNQWRRVRFRSSVNNVFLVIVIMEFLFECVISGIISAITVYVIIYLWILPMDRIRTLEDDVGFAHVSGSGKRKKEAINRLRKSRKTGKIPYPFPNGWYALAESREVSWLR